MQSIENAKLKAMTVPKEELLEDDSPVGERISQFYEDEWIAPAVDGEDVDYLANLFLAPHRNNPNNVEFSETETPEVAAARLAHRHSGGDRDRSGGDGASRPVSLTVGIAGGENGGLDSQRGSVNYLPIMTDQKSNAADGIASEKKVVAVPKVQYSVHTIHHSAVK